MKVLWARVLYLKCISMKKVNCISIIDDDPITVFGIKKMLNNIGASDHIVSYANGKEALDELKEWMEEGKAIPDVIFLDINMPIMDGWQFLEEFIRLPIEKKIRINIVTSSIDKFDRERWEYYKKKTDHIIDFRNKPIRPAVIEEITTAA